MSIIDNDVVIYVPSNISVNRYYKDKHFNNVKSISYDITDTCDIVIPNIGFIKVKSGKINVDLNNNMDIYVREPLI